jgi:hypothetical protein
MIDTVSMHGILTAMADVKLSPFSSRRAASRMALASTIITRS